MPHRPTLFVLISIASLSSCQSWLEPSRVTTTDSYLFSVPGGSHIELLKPVTIPAEQARVYIQNGNLYLQQMDVNQYTPYCEFELYDLSPQPRTIQPDTFIIKQVLDEMYTSTYRSQHLQTVTVNFSPMLTAYSTSYYLQSLQQPAVYRLSCLYWSDVSSDSFPTYNEITRTLDGLFRFKLKHTAPI